MDTQKLKLAIIQRITKCEDRQLLETVYQMLDQLDTKGINLSKEQSSDPQLIAALLGETDDPSTASDQTTSQEEIDDLQQSIDDVFGQ
ncbi:MAG: hypothetical protein AAFZ63_02415 [Bacteroidota bacterium]